MSVRVVFGSFSVLRHYMLSDTRKSAVAVFYTVRKLLEVSLYWRKVARSKRNLFTLRSTRDALELRPINIFDSIGSDQILIYKTVIK